MINSINWPKESLENLDHVEDAEKNLLYLENLKTEDFKDFVDSFEDLSKNPPISTKWIESAIDSIINETLNLSKEDALQLLSELKEILHENNKEHIFTDTINLFTDHYYMLILNSTDNMTPGDIEERANKLKAGAMLNNTIIDSNALPENHFDSLKDSIFMNSTSHTNLNEYFKIALKLSNPNQEIGNLIWHIKNHSGDPKKYSKTLRDLKDIADSLKRTNKDYERFAEIIRDFSRRAEIDLRK